MFTYALIFFPAVKLLNFLKGLGIIRVETGPKSGPSNSTFCSDVNIVYLGCPAP